MKVDQKVSNDEVKVYFMRIPTHKFLHIRNYASRGYWDFWQKQETIPGQDCETICGILNRVTEKLDAVAGKEGNAGSGQLMAWINAPTGRIGSWGIPLAEVYGVRLPSDYDGCISSPMQLMDVPEGEIVAAKVENAIKTFDNEAHGCKLDLPPERIFYFYHDCERYFKYVQPVGKL